MFLQFREEKANRALRDENAELALEAQRTVETIESLRRQVRAAPLILVLNLNLRLVIRHRSVN
jgi:outer membrane lipopolysaccharide assembly protein LptE/RlpB